jgi:hypothetical protein
MAAKTGEAIWPGTVTVAGTPYACTVVPSSGRGILQDGYEENVLTQVVRVRKTLMATEPVRDSFWGYDGKSWQVREVSGEAACHAEWVVVLEKKK